MTTSQQSDVKLRMPKFHVLTIFVFYITIIESRLQQVSTSPEGGSLSDLNIQPIIVDENVLDRDAVQLNISWKSANLGARKIDVHLYPVKNEHCSHTTPCPVYDLPANTTHILIPDNPMLDIIPSHATSSRCYVRLGCEFDVMVHSTGRSAQSLQLKRRYRVPDCVDTFCICTNTQHLPAVSLNATMDDDANMLKIVWHINTPTYDWDAENVSLSELFLSVQIKPDARVPWGGGGGSSNLGKITQEIPLSNPNNTQPNIKVDGFYHLNLTDAKVNMTNFNVFMRGHVIDSRRCAGNETSFTYKVESNKIVMANASNHFVKTFLVCFFILVLLLVTGFVFTYRRMQHILLTKSFVKNWRVFYQNEPNTGFKQMKFQENFLYGEDYFEHCEIPHSSLKMSHNIGKGAFGSVYLAVANQIGSKQCSGLVAVKKLKKDHNVEEMDEFLSEISMMKSIPRHPNIVSLIGYCTVKQPMLMVMEYVGCGDLLNYLRRLRDQYEMRSAAAMAAVRKRSENPIRQFTGNKITENSASSTLQLLSQNSTTTNGTRESYGNLMKNKSSGNQTTSPDTAITVTTLKQLEQQMNYLELCYSEASDMSTCSTKEGSIASTKRISDGDNYVGYPSSQDKAMLECILDHRELHNFAVQIARGMKHLEDRGIIHRDLAARNILIDEHKQLKISDFGLSRSIIYVTEGKKKMPIRWMAIEALRQNVYTSKSDVWSFAVLLWEIGTLGGIPYAHVSNELLLKYLIDGNRLQWPEICSEELYKLMRRCWSESPDDRPFFAEIVQMLEQKESNAHVYVNFDSIASNYVFPPTMPVESGHLDA